MKELHKAHNRIVLLYIAIPGLALLLTVICARFLLYLPPFWVLGVILSLCPFICAIIRLRIWRNKETMMSSVELNTPMVKMFFIMIPIEMSISLLGLAFVVLGKL